MDVSRIQGTDLLHQVSKPSSTEAGLETFGEFLQHALVEVNRLQQEAEKSTRDFAVGQAKSIHETMITMEKADIALRLITQIRNKGIEAYHELMRMQI